MAELVALVVSDSGLVAPVALSKNIHEARYDAGLFAMRPALIPHASQNHLFA